MSKTLTSSNACRALVGSVLAASLLAGPAEAQSPVRTADQPQGASDRFAPFEESYVLIVNRMSNNGWADSDEVAMRGRFSFKYTMFGERFVRRPARTPADQGSRPEDDWEVFLAYTGEFDFYAGTRTSGPVVNRLNNPGIHWRLPLPRKWGGDGDDNFTLSLEHRSNGQSTDVETPLGIERVTRAYSDAANAVDSDARRRGRHYFDSISRGSNFIGAKFELTDALGVDDLYLSAKLRFHFSEEFQVNWGPRRCTRRCIADFDRVQLQAAYRWGDVGWFDAQWRLGDKGAATDSFTFGYQTLWKSFPLYVRVHRGPMNTLSNYSQRQDSVGIGLRFAYR